VKNPRIAGFILFAASGVFASAQVTTNQKIGVIDMQSALTATKDGQKAAADLRAKYAPKQQEFQQRQSQLQQKQDQFRRTENTMSEDAKAKLAADIDALQRNLKRDTQDAEQDMNQDQQRIVQGLSGKMMKIVSKYAQDHQFQLVFDVAGQPSNIFFASNTIDITRDIIALYDQENPGTGTSSSAAPASSRRAVPAGAPRTAPSPATAPRTTPSPATNAAGSK
jgi:outer membrane protein